MPPRPRKLTILGAGPSGLTLARLLPPWVDYTIYESRPNPALQTANDWGGSLDIHTGTGQAALRAAGLLERFRSIARWDVPTRLADGITGRVVPMDEGGEEARPEIDRSALRKLLMQGIPPGRLKFGKKVTSVSPGRVEFEDGTEETGMELIVGADGTFSRTRKAVTDALPRYKGVSLFAKRLEGDHPLRGVAEVLAGQGTYMALAGGRVLVVQANSGGAYFVYLGMRVEEGGMLRKDVFGGWDGKLKGIVEGLEGFKTWGLYSLPTDALPWRRTKGITLIGDAAHVSCPNGEGVNVGMWDALKLAEAIGKGEVLDEAVREYEEEMFPRAREQIKNGNDTWETLMKEGTTPETFISGI
ncbi:FAD/NAD(P)-binding domain-containing protein [Piedraia hortae CBS 480.64]|uniref:FAD/NAD(P)-binding domain-containing protein n=1 Tax=Piedraia hortae CBS 480.64 TaxID=1314780 RepID=A0A6A7CAI3_9PEZI|nr:FAD/NAD(P)-binding domain-containing protein [Piedraia hortae CBS 480.64]